MIVVHDLPDPVVLQQKKESSARIATDSHRAFRKIVRKFTLPELEINAWLKIKPEQTVAKHLRSVAQPDASILPTSASVIGS